jgi:hypothetical protein
VTLKSCTVIIQDLNQTEHALDVTAETLYEAVAQALAALGANDWADDIGRGLTTATIKVRHARREDPGFRELAEAGMQQPQGYGAERPAAPDARPAAIIRRTQNALGSGLAKGTQRSRPADRGRERIGA